MKIGLFIPCYINAAFPEVGVASYKLLKSLGLDVDYPLDQTCCGQPMANAGFEDESLKLALRMEELFKSYDYVVGPSASCVAFVRINHPQILQKANHPCMHQAGIENVVASSGTALTQGQIRLIHRFTNNITVLYDGDAPGIKAALRGINLLLDAGMHVKVLLLPDGEDPDSFARKHNATEFSEFIKAHGVAFCNQLVIAQKVYRGIVVYARGYRRNLVAAN